MRDSALNREKEPCVPFRSGVPMAESSRPLNFSGGNVTGTRRMVDRIRWRPKMAQNDSLRRMASTDGRRRTPKWPARAACAPAVTLAEESSGT